MTRKGLATILHQWSHEGISFDYEEDGRAYTGSGTASLWVMLKRRGRGWEVKSLPTLVPRPRKSIRLGAGATIEACLDMAETLLEMNGLLLAAK